MGNQHWKRQTADTRHHDQTKYTGLICERCSLSSIVIEEMGNPFEEESQDVVKLDTKEIAGPAAVETVMNARGLAKSSSRLSPESVCWTEQGSGHCSRNKLKVFEHFHSRSQSKVSNSSPPSRMT
ncbi:hypothetical protein AAFF_G00179450 [Aldrovandia affinis]|uniref:Uncharacterized protein n=1 Tax=Aldrovandia affinis TaxID=143900 RepID=A0AAD7RKH3_9TELE|nr:hypothetical protein AAFF_G00179450 [Aldrovandia affinis]